MKKPLLLLLPLFLFANIPQDERLIKGQLENGLTYYVQKNDLPKNCASLRLVVKTGSLDGNPNEVGIAHLIEHLALHQTENFSEHKIYDFLDSIGAPIGADSNGVTGPYRTLYKFDLPLEKEDTFDQGLSILSEIAGRTKITKNSAKIEKGIVLNEARDRDNQSRRFFHQWGRWLTNNAFCLDEQPKCVKVSTAKSLNDFYYRYYTPNRMAVIVVGAIDPGEVVAKIHEKFSYIKKKKGSPPVQVNFNHKNSEKFFSYMHSDVAGNTIMLQKTVSPIDALSGEEIRKLVCQTIFITLLEKRSEHLLAEEGSPFIEINVATPFGGIAQDKDIFEISFEAFEDREEQALQKLYSTVQSAIYSGLGEETFRKEIACSLQLVESSLKNAHQRKNNKIAGDYAYHFEKGIHSYDYVQFLKSKKQCLETLSYEEFNEIIQNHFGEEDFWLCHNGNKVLKSAPLVKIISTPWDGKKLCEIKQKSLSIHLEKSGDINIHSFHLSNGMKVVLKKTDFEKNKIYLQGFAKGGYFSMPPEYIEASKFAVQYQFEASFGGLTINQLNSFLSQKNVHAYLNIADNKRLFGGSSVSGNHEELFKLSYALFMDRNKDSGAFKRVLSRSKAYEQNSSNHPQTLFSRKLGSLTFNEHPLTKAPNFDHITQENCEYVLAQSFGNPSEFTVVIVGDFELEKMKGWVKKYLASIPYRKLPLSINPTLILPHPDGVIEKTLVAGDKRQVQRVMNIFMPSKIKTDATQLYFVERLVTDALTETFRREEGISYSPFAFIVDPLEFKDADKYLRLVFSTSPSDLDRHESILEKVFMQLKETPPSIEKIAGIREEIRSEIKKSFESNAGWLQFLTNRLMNNRNIYYDHDDSFLDEYTPEKIHNTMQEILDYKDANTLIWLPEGE